MDTNYSYRNICSSYDVVVYFEIKWSPILHSKSGINICILPEFDAVYQRNSTTATPTNTVTHRQQKHWSNADCWEEDVTLHAI